VQEPMRVWRICGGQPPLHLGRASEIGRARARRCGAHRLRLESERLRSTTFV